MEPLQLTNSAAVKNIKCVDKTLKKGSLDYLRIRELAKVRKQRFLNKMTPEQKEIQRAKNREYHKYKRDKLKIKRIADLSEEEKRNKRISWKMSTRKYREAKKNLANMANKIQSQPSDEPIANIVVRSPEDINERYVQNQDKEIEELAKRITQTKRKLKYLKKKSQRKQAMKKSALKIPDGKEDDSTDNQTPRHMHNNLFSEILKSKLHVKADALLISCKTGEVFEICDIEFASRERNLLHMVMKILPNESSNITILNSDVKSHETTGFFDRDKDSETRPIKINCLRKIIS